MTILTALYGAFLTALGLFAYFGISSESITALIPVFFGVPILIISALQASGLFVRIGLVVTTALAAIGFFATLSSLFKLPALLGEAAVQRPEAVMIQATMCILSLLYIVPAIGTLLTQRASKKAA